MSGIIGIGIRYVLIKSIAKKCGKNVSVNPNVFIFFLENLSLGDNVSIHPMSYIDATGNINIGNDVSIAHGVTILSSTYTFKNKDRPIKEQEIRTQPTIIGNNVWIGAKATVLIGNKIGSGVVVGTGTVVTKDINSDSIVVGNPEKKQRID